MNSHTVIHTHAVVDDPLEETGPDGSLRTHLDGTVWHASIGYWTGEEIWALVEPLPLTRYLRARHRYGLMLAACFVATVTAVTLAVIFGVTVLTGVLLLAALASGAAAAIADHRWYRHHIAVDERGRYLGQPSTAAHAQRMRDAHDWWDGLICTTGRDQ